MDGLIMLTCKHSQNTYINHITGNEEISRDIKSFRKYICKEILFEKKLTLIQSFKIFILDLVNIIKDLFNKG
jgi:hypothetical protein